MLGWDRDWRVVSTCLFDKKPLMTRITAINKSFKIQWKMYLPKPSKLQTEKEEQGGYFYKNNTIRVGASYSMAGKQRIIATCIKLDTHFIDLTIDLFQDIYVQRIS